MDQPPGSSHPRLTRDAFVANVLWVGVCFFCQGQLGSSELDFRGNRLRGEAHCDNGQGDHVDVFWDEHGVLALVRDDDALPVSCYAKQRGYVPFEPLPPPPPADLRGLIDRARSGLESATGWLWICGDTSSPHVPPAQNNSLLGMMDAFSGPSLIERDEDHALERGLLEAILAGQEELPAELVGRLLAGPVDERGGDRLEAALIVAAELSRFGLRWPDLERDVAER